MTVSYITLDDNPTHLEILNSQLAQIPALESKGAFLSPVEAMSYLQQQMVDVVFMDIEMPGITGIDLAKQLQNPPFFVFISSHPEFGAETYEVDALDYILKPVSLKRILKTVKRLHQIIESRSKASNEISTNPMHSGQLFIRENQQYIKIELEQLLYAESLNSFVHLFMQDGKKHLVLVGLKSLEEQLPSHQFMRVSRCILINLNRITAYNTSHVYIQQLNFAIGPSYAAEVHETLNRMTIHRFGDS